MSIRYEDRLDGISNYIPWKVRIIAVLKEWKISSFASTKVTNPTNMDALEEFESLESISQRVILDRVKDHLIPHLEEKKTSYYIWDALKKKFKEKNENQKMALKDKLHNVKMNQGEGVTSYLT